MQHRITLRTAAALFLASLLSIEAAAVGRQHVFFESDLTQNLSQATAEKIYQDSSGFIWVLTFEGLNRFDGVQNLIFRTDVSDPSSLSDDRLLAVVEDEFGRLWFGTAEGGINLFLAADNSFRVFRAGGDSLRSPLSDRIRSLSPGRENVIWVGYEDGGFSALDTTAMVFKHFSSANYQLLSNQPVTSVIEREDGSLLIATSGAGLLEMDADRKSLSSMCAIGSACEIGDKFIETATLDDNGNTWIGSTKSGAYRIGSDGGVRHFAQLENPYSKEITRLTSVNGFLFSDNGRVYIAAEQGIAMLPAGYTRFTSLPIRGRRSAAFPINSIVQDDSGLLWAGGYSGVFVGFESVFETIGADAGLSSENVLSVATLNDESIVVGTTDGLYRIQRGVNRGLLIERYLPELVGSTVTSLLAEDDLLWVGTFREGLYKIDLSDGFAEHYSPGSILGHGISDEQITSIFRDSYGNLWVGTFTGGLNVMLDGRNNFQAYRHFPSDPMSISNDSVMVIYQESNGELWIGTQDGLNRFDYETAKFERFLHEAGVPSVISSRVIFAIHEDSKSRLWVGTRGGGLNMWEPFDRKRSLNKFSYYQSNINLPSNNIFAIQGDSGGNIWIATTVGLTRFNFDRNETKNFTVDDGLQSNDFNFGASYRDAEGRLYFGGTSGLNVFDPESIRVSAAPPRVALTRISLGNEQVWFDKPYDQVEKIELNPDDYLLGFEFAALDYRAPHRNTYRYRMVGLDRDWVDIGNRHTIDFSKLPMGQYVLRVQGATPDGVWSTDDIELDIIVHPPLYLTWYAFVAYTLAVLMLVAAFFYRQRRRAFVQMQYQMQLEDDVRARTLDLRASNEALQEAVEEAGSARQDAERANQAKSEFLAALSHEIRTPMHGVLGMTDLLLHSGLNERQLNFAESAHVSANELLGLIDNILDFSKIEAGKLELEETTFDLREMVENLCYLYGELAQSKNLELNLVFNLDLRRQLYGDPVRLRQILQNLLSNAIKFTRRGSVNLLVSETSHKGKSLGLELVVEDTGIGMDDATIQRVFEAFSQADSSTTRQFGGTGLGLSIAKQLIDLMQGELQVNSRPGVGTTMRVELALDESPIYTERLITDGLENYYAEVVAPVPETRDMFQRQLEAAGIQTRTCAELDELSSVTEQPRLVLVDVGSLYTGAGIAQVENLAQDPSSVVLLITPLSGTGIPQELKHLPHTIKPARLTGLLSDLRAAESHEAADLAERGENLMRFEQRILLVEDIAANQEIARAMLESFGCKVSIAQNGEVALEMYQHEDYDLVLMDCQMPVMDGFEATRHIRQLEARRPGGVRIPVVALTAGKTETEKERCYAAGMDRILFKPYSTAELNTLLGKYFSALGKVEPRRLKEAAPSVTDLLDMKALDNIRNIDAGGDLLSAVFENFKADGEQKLEELRNAVDDPRALGAGAHAIKSMSLNIGAKALSEYCRVCESRWKDGQIEEAGREVEVLAGHFHDASRALEQVLSASGESVE